VLNQESEVAEYYLSAFFTAARSVTFILRIEKPDDYETKSRNWYAGLSAEDHDLMDFLVNQRNKVKKEDAVEGTFLTVSLIEFMQDVYRRGGNVLAVDGATTPRPPVIKSEAKFADRPDASVDAGCRTYLHLLTQLVSEFER
jgi:hypothetical protein